MSAAAVRVNFVKKGVNFAVCGFVRGICAIMRAKNIVIAERSKANDEGEYGFF